MPSCTDSAPLSAAHLVEARDWVYDCFPDAPEDLTDAEVGQAIARYYDGGLQAFRASM